MKPGECWYLNVNTDFNVFSDTPELCLKLLKPWKTKPIYKDQVFIIINENIWFYDYGLYVLIDNEKWYFEVNKQSVEAGLFKKII